MAAPMKMRLLQQSCRLLKYSRAFMPGIASRNAHFVRLASKQPIGVSALNRRVLQPSRLFSATRILCNDVEEVEEEEYHNIIKNSERSKGVADSHDFQAETKKLLDIVARSLYSEKEVFIRELISNGSDALEKLRYTQMTGADIVDKDRALEIHIATDDDKKRFTIQDTGIGLTKDELIDNLGVIARSGSKAFLEEVGGQDAAVDKNIIGQFGVGFYSTFMVAEKVDVYTQSYKPDSPALKWQSDGMGSYTVTEAEGVQRGTKIVLHLKGDCYDFAKEEIIKDVIKKYSNFVGVPIFLNGKKINVIQALWTANTRDITDDQHEEFYRFIANAYDKPRFHLHYKADAPLNIRALFYVPEYKPTMFDMSRDTDVAVTLYSRKVMIMNKANHILPRWLRFLKGVVDSEDIPLNLSRELLQDSSHIRKLQWVLTNRILKFFHEKSKKDPESYAEFYNDYGLFFREGVVSTPDQQQREEIAKLLRFETSKRPPGEKINLEEYVAGMEDKARNIYYFSAASRQIAESSPYFEAMKGQDVEVLFCYEPYDELVLMNLGQFDKKNMKSIENDMLDQSKDDKGQVDSSDSKSLTQEQADDLVTWLQITLGSRIQKAKITSNLSTYPCVITATEMGAARHFLNTNLADKTTEEKLRILQPNLEINPSHPIIRKLHSLKSSDDSLARILADQLFDNAMMAAGVGGDPRAMLGRLNELLTRVFESEKN